MAQESKPVLVRVKRKLCQDPLDSFWLEVNQRPLKKVAMGFSSLSISSSSGKEARTTKLLMQHVDTVNSPDAIKDALESFLVSNSAPYVKTMKTEERRNMLKQQKLKQNHLRPTSMQKHEDMARSARFEQIWRSRKKTMQQTDDSLHERYSVYDIMRIDGEHEMTDSQELEDVSLDVEDAAILSNYMPLINEFLPSASKEIESEVSKAVSYVYDIYAEEDDVDENEEIDYKDSLLVQVNDDDNGHYDGQSGSEDHDTYDSNADKSEDHDYPDEPDSDCEEQCEDDRTRYRDIYDGLDDSDFYYEGQIDKHKDSDSEYEGPIDMEGFQTEMEELRWRYR